MLFSGWVLKQKTWKKINVLKAEWVPHRHFPLLAAQLRKDTKTKSLPAVYSNLHCTKLFWSPCSFLGATGQSLNNLSPLLEYKGCFDKVCNTYVPLPHCCLT